MSIAVAEGCFLSALQPNSSCTAYVVPSDVQIGADGPVPDAVAKARRVQEQVRMRLAEKRSSSLPRLNGLACDSTDFSVPAVKSYTQSRGFSSRSMIHTPSRIMSVATGPLHSSGFSTRSAVDTGMSRGYRMSQSGGSVLQSSYQTTQARSKSRRSKSLSQDEHEELPQSLLVPSESPAYFAPNPAPSMRRSLSGTLIRGGGGANWQDEELAYQQTYRGPSHRTISRITNRQQHQQQQQQQLNWGQEGWTGAGSRMGTMAGGNWGRQWQQQQVSRGGSVLGTGQYQAPLHRAASLRSIRSVGRGADVMDGGSVHSNDKLGGIHGLDMATAVRYLSEPDSAVQVLGAAYIQHQCYHSNDAKNQVRALHGIPALVQLFSSESQEVQRFTTGAMRNLIYENADNKTALISAGGVMQLVNILKEPDEELCKNITGILWNLSSRDNLKEKLSKETLSELTERVLVPLCRARDSGSIQLSPSEKDIFYNTTGCLRNLSSVNERTRQKMRDMRGLVDSLVAYIQNALQVDQIDDKGVENTMCVLRNLSYQLYMELPLMVRQRLEGPSRASATKESQAIGCFILQSKKAKERNQELSVFSEVSRQPQGAEWLWHPQVVGLYKAVLQNNDASATTREASVGALQNITTGEARWASVLSHVMLEQERMLPVLLELLGTHSDMELRPLTGLLRNLARHARNKDHMAKTMVDMLVLKLPSDGLQKEPSSEVVVNICGALNHLVTSSSLAARYISYFNGLPKLVGIKTSHDNSSGARKAAKAASTVLCNMFQYNKLHRDYKLKGFARRDFTDATV
ncbi:plakophilin-3 isoform 2-T2 [Polymixia lowei]